MNNTYIEDTKNYRKFGTLFSLVSIFIAFYSYNIGSEILKNIFLILFVYFLLSSIFIPKFLKVPFQLWLAFGKLINNIMSPLILGIIFYFIITPISLFFKFINRDELKINFKNYKSSWMKKSEDSNNKEKFKKQF